MNSKKRIRTMPPKPMPKTIEFSLVRRVQRRDGQDETVARGDTDSLPALERLGALHAPLLAVHARPTLGIGVIEHDADAADQFLAARDDRTPAGFYRDACD